LKISNASNIGKKSELGPTLTALPKDRRPMGKGIKVREIGGDEVQDDSMMETEVCGCGHLRPFYT